MGEVPNGSIRLGTSNDMQHDLPTLRLLLI